VLFVIVNAFMASLPKKVFEHLSEGIIHKTQIYVYLFMTFTIDEWIDNVRSEITEGLKNGPVIVL